MMNGNDETWEFTNNGIFSELWCGRCIFCRKKRFRSYLVMGLQFIPRILNHFNVYLSFLTEKYTIFAVWLIAKAAFITFILKNDFSFLLQFPSCNEMRHVSGITGFLTYLSIAVCSNNSIYVAYIQVLYKKEINFASWWITCLDWVSSGFANLI